MLRISEIDLTKTIQMGEATEQTKQHIQEFKKESAGETMVDRIQKTSNSGQSSMVYNCRFCEDNHPRGCSVWEKMWILQKWNHYTKCCEVRKRNENSSNQNGMQRNNYTNN